MPKPPKSPLEKPGSGHTRRPSGPKRTTSSEKSSTNSSSSKRGAKGAAVGHASARETQGTMSVSSTAAKAPDIGGGDPDEDEQRSQSDFKPGQIGTPPASTSLPVSEVSGTRGKEIKGGEIDLVRSRSEFGEGPARMSTSTDPSKHLVEEVDRLKAAVSAQISLSQQREKLAKQLNEKESQASNASVPSRAAKSKVSPINEEASYSPSIDAAFSSPLIPSVETTSTESGKTVRGDFTPSAYTTRTPSYPFPPMKPPRQLSFGSHRPFTALSPTVAPEYFPGGLPHTPRDRWTSGSVTPASAAPFQPAESPHVREDPNYPSPNLYKLSLMLSSEPGLDAWWTNVVQIMRDIYKADRVTLAVPADSTDIENVPWGQKATFNAMDEDKLSMGYLPRGSSLVASSQGDAMFTSHSSSSTNDIPADPHPAVFSSRQIHRPELQSRHSFTAYEKSKRAPELEPEVVRPVGSRPTIAPRSKSYLPPASEPVAQPAFMQNVALQQQFVDDTMEAADAKISSWAPFDVSQGDIRGRVFSVLQALDYEADPLIDSSGVIRVLQRGRHVALTRDYPYIRDPEASVKDKSTSGSSKRHVDSSSGRSNKSMAPEVIQRMSNIFGGGLASIHRNYRTHTSEQSKPTVHLSQSLDDTSPVSSSGYEEYEQAPPSPWSQSPAPSPAIRPDPAENPFFAAAEVDEESFNPAPVVTDYSSARSVEAIGIDRSYTVLHIPLNHPVLSKPVQSFRLDAAALEFKSTQSSKELPEPFISTPKSHGKTQAHEKPTPIAILSILSPVIPYPNNLRHSLEHLSPHLATSFSLCQHYSNLEAEIAGLQRKRPHVAGFGAVVRPPDNLLPTAYSPSEGELRQVSAGSITSPSDYSGLSRSNAGSPAGTPGWDPTSAGLGIDRRPVGVSPGYVSGFNEGYFSSGNRLALARVDAGSGGDRSSKEQSPSETRPSRKSKAEEPTISERGRSVVDHHGVMEASKMSPEQGAYRNIQQVASQQRQVRTDRLHLGPISEPQEAREFSPAMDIVESSLSQHPPAVVEASARIPGRAEYTHTKLHTGGVDLGTTFPSLPSRHSPSGPVEMLPPSDRLKTLMLDTLPCHVFVALPVTGEIVWINNRYLSYRGQTISQLRDDPWGSIHPDEREDYLKSWSESIRTGRPFSKQVRIRRFDGSYRWFFTRAVAGKDTKNVIIQWYGSHMDIHDQHEAEVKAARQEESKASEANYRLLANLIPQIIFAASEDKGVIFANEQWLSYTGQDYEEALELGFMGFVHPDDFAKCRIPFGLSSLVETTKKRGQPKGPGSQASSGGKSSSTDTKSSRTTSETPTEATIKDQEKRNDPNLSRTNSSSSELRQDLLLADLSTLTKSGAIQVTVDSNGRQSYTTEVRLRSKNGEYRWHLVRCVEVENFKFGGGEGHGSWFGACTDINDHKLLETKLKEAMDSKSKFLSNMSHEIRTPLIGISGMVSFLQDTILNEEQLDYTNTIQTSANSLLSIINDILDLSKVDAGMMKLSYEWFHARSVIEEVNELVSTMAISKRLELNYIVDEDVPAMVKGDKIRIRQVLLNVIGNAIKFTTEGEVFSTCKVYHGGQHQVAENEIMLEFSILDTGRGFTKEEAELIFKPFSQIDGSSTRQHGGSGLGLVISRQLVELHGGKMEGSAIPGKGSTFSFTAKFGLPTETDHPEPMPTPQLSKTSSFKSTTSFDGSGRAIKLAGVDAMVSHRFLTSPSPMSPRTDPALDSPAFASSASSDPSLRSTRSSMTGKSSVSSINQGLVNFSEAARASGQDLLNMKLAIPPKLSSETTPTQESISPRQTESGSSVPASKHFRPPMYSILVICPQTHSREATTKHIEQTLPKVVPYQITTSASVIESQRMIGGDDPVIFTHIVLNLGSSDEIIALIDQIFGSLSLPLTSVVILSDPVQRQTVIKQAPQYDYDKLAKENRVTFIYKPVKPSRFAVIFDPDKERDLSIDRNRSSAQQQVANQKQNYLDVEAKLGNKGYKLLLVEDNLVNQKVLLKYLTKVGIEVEIARDGVECIETVFSKPHSHYSLILCDLHMPRKDGYQTCREIRTWEKVNQFSLMPIIALSANVMAEVIEKCAAAGFNSYVTKPVDFKMLSSEMAKFLDRSDPTKPHALMRTKV